MYLDCDIGWTKFNGSCYMVSSGKKPWTDSRNDCKDRNADLVTIESPDEQVRKE
uniref:C-type lectin domain-containing protein n=1 Tax=Sphaeramia orbicularis TaxID=375764 RepID=A0A673A7M5_9TELE